MPTAPARRRSLGRRLLFLGVGLLLLYAALELLALGAYWALLGRPFSPAAVAAARARLAGELPGPLAARPLAMQDSGGDMCIHPYLGFVANHDTDDQVLLPGWGPHVTRWGFVDFGGIVRNRRPDLLLVGIFGGSVAEFFAADGAAELARRLRAHPAYAGRRVEFVRMGLGGFKQPQQLFALTWLLAMGGELDLAVNLDGFNDATLGLIENEPRGVPHFFPRNWALLAEHAPDAEQRRRMGTATLLQDARAGLAAGFGGRPWRWSVTASLLWELLDRGLARGIAEQLTALQAHARADAPFHLTGPGVVTGDDDGRAAAATELWERCSRAMAGVCAANGIGYWHFLQPNQYDAGSKVLTAQEQREAIEPGSRYQPWIARGYPRLREAGERLARDGVRFVDLTRVFAGVAETIYIDNCCHVNVLGNEILGRAIAGAILRDAPAGAGPRPAGGPLRAEPAELDFERPFARAELRVLAGGDDVTYLETAFASADATVARVDDYGTVVAVRGGATEIHVRHGAHELAVPVRVRPAPVVDLGGAAAPAGLVRPRLDHAGPGRFRVRRPGSGLPGALVAAVEPAPRAFCGGKLFVPLASPYAQPLAGGDGEVEVEVAFPEGLASGTLFVQALFKVSDEPCGFAVSNGLAVTR